MYARGFGAANLRHREPITASTVFNVASLSKQFTAAAVAILIRRGRIRLDDEVKRYTPEMPAYPGPVRIEHLIYMTSGLHEYYTLPRPGRRDWSDPFTVEDAIAATLAQPALAFNPGERWAYSNVNYMLLAEIVSRVSGISFAEFAEREIFAPLGMTSTHVNDDLSLVWGEFRGRRTLWYEGGDAGFSSCRTSEPVRRPSGPGACSSCSCRSRGSGPTLSGVLRPAHSTGTSPTP